MGQINPLIALAIPTWGKVSINWARALRHMGGPLGCNMMDLAPVVGKPIAEARNELMTNAVAEGCDFLFFLGDDVLVPPDTLHRLLQRMWDDPNLHLVTGVYWTKTWPTAPYIWRGIQRGPYYDWKHGEFFEVDYAGCDCLLVRLSPQVKELGPEWFSTDWSWEEEPAGSVPMLSTEDFYFYTKTRKVGLKLWCDTQVQCVHEDRASGAQFGLTDEMPQFTGKEPELPEAKTDEAPLVKLAELGCGLESPYFGRPDRVKVVRFDANESVKPDYRCDLRNIPVVDESFDVVHSRHVLEHFGRSDVMRALREWTRILRVGGEMRLSVPNILTAMKNIILMEEGIMNPDPYPFWQLYGKQDDQHDFHFNGFTPKRLQLLLERVGAFDEIAVTTGDGDDDDLNVLGKVRKARHIKSHTLLPEWDEIEVAEGIRMVGRDNGRKDDIPVPEGALVEGKANDKDGQMRVRSKRKKEVK